MFEGVPGDGTVHSTRVQAVEPQLGRNRLRNGGLAGAGRAVDSNNHEMPFLTKTACKLRRHCRLSARDDYTYQLLLGNAN